MINANNPKYKAGSRVIVLEPNGKLSKGIVENVMVNNKGLIAYTVKSDKGKDVFLETAVMLDKEYYKALEELRRREAEDDGDLDYGDEG